MTGRNASCPKTPAFVTNFRRMPMAILETPALIQRPPSGPNSNTIKTAVVGPSPAKPSPSGSGFWMFTEAQKASPDVAGPSRGTVSGFQASLPESTSFFASKKENIPRPAAEARPPPAKRVCFELLPVQQQQQFRNPVKWAPKPAPVQPLRQTKPAQEPPKPQYSKPDPKKLRIITGSVEHILRLSRSSPEDPPLVELYANILSVKKGAHECERMLLLRNKSGGPVIQAVFFEIDFRMPVAGVGDLVRCVGRLTGGSRLQILKITAASEEEERMSNRLQVVSGFAAGGRR